MKPNVNELKFLTGFIKEKSGISISESNSYLLENKISPILSGNDIESYASLIIKLRNNEPVISKKVIDAITTNETLFFRDQKPFEVFKNRLISDLRKKYAPGSEINILCAACSTGQEPYSIAISLMEERHFLREYKVKITGFDLCSDAIEKAKKGVFNQFEVQRGLPVTLLVKYFEKISEYEWQIKQELKDMIRFYEQNLFQNLTLPASPDIVFCRNVLIYFEQSDKEKIVKILVDKMKKGGFFFTGSAETFNLYSDALTQDSEYRSMYIKK